MAVTLAPITSDNWLECAHLDVAEEQRCFVAANVYSLAQAYVEPWWVPLAIYANETPVGFIMYGRRPGTDIDLIKRIMIDARYQNKGYGRVAMEAVLTRIGQQPDCHEIRLSYHPDNTVAAHLYHRLGFRPTEEVNGDEIVVRLTRK